jgi:hypothetical protein
MLYGSPVQIPAENIGGLSIDMPGGLGSQFAGGGMALDGKSRPLTRPKPSTLCCEYPQSRP